MGLLLQLAGAVALLLWAIRMVQTGFNRLLGNRLERTLRKTTGHRLMAFTSGGGTAFLLQSSTAVVIMVAGFSQAGMMTLKAGMATVLGAEFGASLAAVLLNLDIKLLALPLVLHSGLNLVNGLLLLSALPWIAPWFKPDSRVDTSVDLYKDADQPIYLALDDIQNPKRALANTRNEALHIADLVYRMLNNAVDAFDDKNLVRQISEMDDDIDRLHREAMNYALSIKEIDQKEGYRRSREEIISFMTNLEHIGDIIDESLMHLARHKQKENVQFTEAQTSVIHQLHEELVDSFRLSQAVFTSDSGELAQELLSAKRSYRKEVLRARQAHIDQLGGHHRENLVSTQIFMDVLRDLQRICSHLTAVSYPVLKRKQLLETSEQ